MPNVPAAAAHMAQRIRAATGIEPDVTSVDRRTYRLTASTDRVTLTIDYRMRKDGSYRPASSALTVDEQPAPLAEDLEHLAAVLANPDTAFTPHSSPDQSTITHRLVEPGAGSIKRPRK